MSLPENFLLELRARNDIVDVASGYVNLKRRGKNMVGLCPFHSEKTPSFNIYPETGSFYCFGCGAGGDVIVFIMKIENISYMEAVRFLAQRASMNIPEDGYDPSLSGLRTRIYEANREAARFYHASLYGKSGGGALTYLRGRALTERTIRRFGLGYAPTSGFELCDHLKKLGFTDSELIAANLATKTRSGKGVHDYFFDRVIFPIIDLRGNVIAFGGRVMTDRKPKYLNTSDTPVFKKSMNLFSLNNAKSAGERRLILCEGYMDVIALNQAGFVNAVATLGTALTEEQAMLMKRYADEVVICYDADEAGQKATARAIGILRNTGVNIKVIAVPDGKDPDEFIRNHGENGYAAFKNILENSGNDVEYRLLNLKKRYNLALPDSKTSYLTEAAKILANLDNSIERDVYAGKLSEETGVEKSAIIQQINHFSRWKSKDIEQAEFQKARREISGYYDKLNPQKPGNLRAARAEEGIIGYLIMHPDRAEKLQERLPPEKMLTDFNRRIYKYFLDRIISGHSPLTNASADLTPEENGRVAAMMAGEKTAASTDAVAEEYINFLLEQNEKLSSEDIKNASDEELMEYIKKQKKKHK